MAKRTPKGLSIEDALRRWGDPALLIRLDQLRTDADQATADAKEHLEPAFPRCAHWRLTPTPDLHLWSKAGSHQRRALARIAAAWRL